jgi:hypothetical protein
LQNIPVDLEPAILGQNATAVGKNAMQLQQKRALTQNGTMNAKAGLAATTIVLNLLIRFNGVTSMKRLFLLAACVIASCLTLEARRGYRNGNGYGGGYGYVGVNVGIGLPLGGTYWADGPQGSNPYYGTPVNYGGFPAPYGYAAYAGPVVYWGW